jgi:hypothetical protein
MIAPNYETLMKAPVSGLRSKAQVDAVRNRLGVPIDTNGVDVVVLQEVDHDTCALIEIAYQRAGQNVSPHTLLAAVSAEDGWHVAGIPDMATAAQKRAIDSVVIQYLTVLAPTPSTDGLLPLNTVDALETSPTVLRDAAFGRWAKTGLAHFRVQQVTDELVCDLWWFASANVTASSGGRTVSFPVSLAGRLDGIWNGPSGGTRIGVNGATLGAATQ